MDPRSGSLIVVVGMNSEARLARPLGHVIVGAAALSKGSLSNARGILSFGLCGALDPALAPGDLIIGTSVNFGGRRFEADADWLTRLDRNFPGAARGAVAGSTAIVATAVVKAELRLRTGAIAADMESHNVAWAAAEAGIPLVIVRAVSDGATDDLPLSAQAGFHPNGRTDVAAVIRGLMARPAELPGLIGVALNAAKGFATLERAASALCRDVQA